MADRKRDLALFNLAIDSKLRGCDVVAVRVDDMAPSGYATDRAIIRQKKTGRPVRFELTDQTRQASTNTYARAGHTLRSTTGHQRPEVFVPRRLHGHLRDVRPFRRPRSL